MTFLYASSICIHMPTRRVKTPANFRIDAGILRRLRGIRLATGVPVSEQVRRAIEHWLADPKVQRDHDFLRKVGTQEKAS